MSRPDARSGRDAHPTRRARLAGDAAVRARTRRARGGKTARRRVGRRASAATVERRHAVRDVATHRPAGAVRVGGARDRLAVPGPVTAAHRGAVGTDGWRRDPIGPRGRGRVRAERRQEREHPRPRDEAAIDRPLVCVPHPVRLPQTTTRAPRRRRRSLHLAVQPERPRAALRRGGAVTGLVTEELSHPASARNRERRGRLERREAGSTAA